MVDVPLRREASLQGCLAEGREDQGSPRAMWEAPIWVFYVGKRRVPGGEVWHRVSWGWQVQTKPSASWGVSDYGFSANEARFAPPVAQSLVSLRCREEQRVSPFARCQPQLATDKWDGCVPLTSKECPLRSCGWVLCPGPVSFQGKQFSSWSQKHWSAGDKEKTVKMMATFPPWFCPVRAPAIP